MPTDRAIPVVYHDGARPGGPLAAIGLAIGLAIISRPPEARWMGDNPGFWGAAVVWLLGSALGFAAFVAGCWRFERGLRRWSRLSSSAGRRLE